MKEQMTKEQATSFSHVSLIHAIIVERTLQCGCKAYVDVFTYNRWQAQGFQVKRGEKALKLAIIREVVDETDEEVKKVWGRSHVFCRHQVKPIEEKE